MFPYFCLWLFKSLSQMAFYFSNLILQTAKYKSGSVTEVIYDFVFTPPQAQIASSVRLCRALEAICVLRCNIFPLCKGLMSQPLLSL